MTRPKTLLELAGAPKLPVTWEKSVLLLIDHQQEYASDGGLPLVGIDAAVSEIAKLLAAARAAGAPVIHIQQMGRPGGALFDPNGPRGAFISTIRPLDGERVVPKTLPNSFAKTDLHEVLQKTGRNELIVGGFMTHMCVSATVRSALDHGYRVSVVASACATRDLPDQLGGAVIAAADLHRIALAELGDRFATILPSADAIEVRAAA
ncbi:cysteine hydrolase family protein [uncultured Ferrovibrio sp.]|jgi:nicotinamidase-related amidase|uniref:cysteine hydrolase family protein n=1 Tax=uncultured Ferrovibrio sp. TaxID=1576913 RepID=UPI00260F2364|nr:cysteine hydrolase family protein [uncultured Ferrovibrio sp.]